jgi:PAS domain S-box-containing protein
MFGNRRPFQVETAVSVEEAMEKMKKKKYDAIVCDYVMPGKNGLQFLKELRDCGNKIPFIMFTGKGREEVAVKALNVGADRYFNKIGDPGTVYGELAHGISQVVESKRAEEALRESRNYLETILNSIFTGVVVIDGETHKIVDANSKALEIIGASRECAIGKVCHGFICPAEEGRCPISDLGQAVDKSEHVLLRTDGKRTPILKTVTILNWRGHKYLIESFINITERKQAEQAIQESQEKFKRLFMDNPEAAVYVDPDFHILDVNPRFTKLFGYSLEEIKGKHIDDVVVPKDKIGEAEILDRKGLEGQFYHETVRKKKDGSLIPVSISIAPIRFEGKLVGTVGLYKDITERKQMEKKLEEYYQHLEELVEKRTRQLKEAQEQLIKSERLAAIGQVAAMVGHDIRNPLTGIKGAAYYLKTKLGPKMDEKAREMLEIIDKDVEHSNKIITDLMEYSKEIRLELTETTPKSIVREALSLVEVPENAQVLDLTQSEPKIKMDVEKMKRVFDNLVKNAVDAMPNGGKLTITSRESDGNVELAFADTGIGMTKEIMEKIWTPFFTTKARGMGLGLAICKRIIEAHRGKISVESMVGKGTTFTVTVNDPSKGHSISSISTNRRLFQVF